MEFQNVEIVTLLKPISLFSINQACPSPIGRYAAQRLFSTTNAEQRFSLATKGETQHREVH